MRGMEHRYKGNVAIHYEADRTDQLAWKREEKVIRKLCSRLPSGSRILDIPCGTGRLLPLFDQFKHPVWGADISLDMLKEWPASRKHSPRLRDLVRTSAERIPFADGAFDYVVCLRFFHLGISRPMAFSILQEFARVAGKGIILHGPMQKQGLFSFFADSTAEVISSGPGAPREAVVQINKAVSTVRKRIARRFRRSFDKSGTESDGGEPQFLCTPTELEQAVGGVGFVITKSFGAISPFSAKRIYLLERT